MRVETRLKTYQKLADELLPRLLPSEHSEPQDLHRAMRYSCLAPGKRLRPALCIASAEAVGVADDEIDAIVRAGCAAEMVHCFSLIHDDLPIIDDDDLRRGAPTCHKVFGEPMALLAGDALFALAFETLSKVEAPSERVILALRSLSTASGSSGLVGGEVLDVLNEGQAPDARLLDEIHKRKTGALIAACCEIGGILAGGAPGQVSALKTFGERVGLAFQIVDDLLNVTSTPEQLGKASGSDHARQKLTYPAVHGMEESKRAAEELLSKGLTDLRASFAKADALEELASYAIERLH